MWFSIALLVVFIYLAYQAAPREWHEDALVHGAGQINLLAAISLLGVDCFTLRAVFPHLFVDIHTQG